MKKSTFVFKHSEDANESPIFVADDEEDDDQITTGWLVWNKYRKLVVAEAIK